MPTKSRSPTNRRLRWNPRKTKRINNMSKEKTRIKDIAERAHNRPNVSPKALEKVQKALEEMDYKPNVYASALAYNRDYHFVSIIPKHESEAYWEEVEEGEQMCCERYRDFRISNKVLYYNRFSPETFAKVMNEALKQEPDGVIVVPSKIEVTRRYTDMMHERNIPFILLDSYMPDLKPLSFFGQDSFASGFFAARMLMMLAPREKEIMLMKQMRNGNVASKQQENRETGFRHYMHDHFPSVTIHEVNLSPTHWSTIASRSIPRPISWASSCSGPTVAMSRSWVTTWYPRMQSASVRAPSRSSSHSTPSCRAIPASRRSSRPSYSKRKSSLSTTCPSNSSPRRTSISIAAKISDKSYKQILKQIQLWNKLHF